MAAVAAQAQGLDHEALHLHRPDGKTLFRIPLRAADARRSVKNILQWNSYLPTDCVRSMVRMGWDYTT
jgi:hypothetical protein